MLSLDANDAYRYTVANNSVGDYNASATSGAWFDVGDKTNANLAARLVKTLITNNTSSSVTSNPGATSVANIVKQVIGQDASRARGEDNSKYLPDNKGLLRFYAGDKIYVAISLEMPTVSVSSGQLVNQNTLQPLYTPIVTQKNKYNLKITLADKFAPGAIPSINYIAFGGPFGYDIAVNPPSDGGSPITSYQYSFNGIDYTDVQYNIDNLGGGVIRHQFFIPGAFGAYAGQTVYIRAVNNIGAGPSISGLITF